MVQFADGDSNLTQYNQVIRHHSIFCQTVLIASMITQLYAVVFFFLVSVM